MKTITKITALLMVALMVVSLAACGKKAPTIIGKWSYDLNMKTMMEASLSSSSPSDSSQLDAMKKMAEAFADSNVKMFLEFSEDGSGTMTVDEASAKEAVEKAKEPLKQLIPSIYAQMAGMTEEEFSKYLETSGMTMDQLVDQVVSSLGTTGLNTKANEFTYTLEGNELTIKTDQDDDESDGEGGKMTISLTDSELSVTDIKGDAEGFEMIKQNFLPMVFKRVNG